ncbi:MAG TPA: FAD-dependent oxidoreductase [Thermoleophilaceae bacterium]|nr:FAD-dependent oxidoreductase [Thermoleophilaceae bacterium]
MPDRSVDFLLIGAGIAGAACVRTLREEGAEGSILLVGREPDPPYHRPPLSKEYLRGEASRTDALVQPEGWWDENDVELLTRTSAMRLDASERVMRLSTKEEVGFGKLLLATGANVRRLRLDGADLEGIHYLRTYGNAEAIRADAADAEHVVTIGGSYIGTEVSASLAEMGKSCTIVMQEEVTLERPFGADVGRFFQGLLEDHGVNVVASDEVDRFEGDGGRVRKVVTRGGVELPCDLVVVGAGVMPDVMLARGSGLELGESGGIACSSRLETSVEGVYAAGDMAEYESVVHDGRALRIEHWDVARRHGKTAALNMLGRDVAHDAIPYFFSDLADWCSLEYVGPGSGEPVSRGSTDDGEFTVFYVDGGRVTAALTVGRPEDLEHARRFIREGAAVDRKALADVDTDLTPG